MKKTTIYTVTIDGRQVKFQLRDDVNRVRVKIDHEPHHDHEMHFGFHPRAFSYGRANIRVRGVFAAEAIRILGIGEGTELELQNRCCVSIYGREAELDLHLIDTNQAYD